MIFVTVGTTYFDELVMEVDRLCRAGVIADRCYMQIGSGKYIPQHADWVRYLDGLRDVEEQADLVICHGGVGSVFELLELNKQFIAAPNRQVKDDHQADLLRALESEGWCNCCWALSQLEDLLKRQRPCKPYPKDPVLARHLWSELFPDLCTEGPQRNGRPDAQGSRARR